MSVATEADHECDFSYEFALQGTTYLVKGFRDGKESHHDYPDGMTYAYEGGKEVMRVKGGFEDPAEAKLLMIGYLSGRWMRPAQDRIDMLEKIKHDAIVEVLREELKGLQSAIRDISRGPTYIA